jgi:hypothetical protein
MLTAPAVNPYTTRQTIRDTGPSRIQRLPLSLGCRDWEYLGVAGGVEMKCASGILITTREFRRLSRFVLVIMSRAI